MKSIRIKYLFCLLGMVTCAIPGFAQKLGLNDAINIALKNSLDIQVSKNNVAISNTNNSYGIAGGLPLVTGTASDNESVTDVNQKLNTGEIIKRNGASSNTLSANLTGSVLLYNGMRVVTTKKRLNQLVQQSEELLNSQVQNTMASVMTAYFDIVRQQGYAKTIVVSIDAAQKKLDIIKTQQSVGLANNADLYQAQVDLNALLQAQQSQQLIIDQAKAELMRVMGTKPDSIVHIQDTILVDRNVTLDTVLNTIHRNADILAAIDQVRINELIEKETTAARYPSVRASAGYNYNRNQVGAGNVLLNRSQGPFVNLGLTVPIYNGSIYKRQQKVAELNTKNAELQRDILVRDYSASVVKNFQAYQSTLKQLETQQRTYELAQQLLDLVVQRFQLRQATIVDMTLAQQSFENAAYSLVNLSYAAKAAEIELKRLANQLSL
ncbi:MAG: TolC family protein [Chitinophagaceae bacterium]